VNTNTRTYVDWLWKAGGAAVTNNDGSISSQVSANTTAGFSIVTYTGTGANTTVGHGLGVVPKLIIAKGRSALSVTSHWIVYHASMNATPQNGRMLLNTDGAYSADAQFWNNTAPTSSVFTLGANNYTNENTDTFIAYCFAEVPGFSSISSYTGNVSTDGPFVYCGFKPKYVMIKNATTGGAGYDWQIFDSKRDSYNKGGRDLDANLSDAEGAINIYDIDFLSNGFKLRNAYGSDNGSSATHIFIAFAEAPFKYTTAR
jgi:hypothetical protein